MRRFQTTSTMSKPIKAFDMPSRATIHSNSSKPRATKYIALSFLLLLVVFLAHTLLTPKDLVYGLMIDAGSTGSRVHTYTFRKQDSKPLQVVQEDFYALKPGLSSYATNPTDAANSLKPLLDRARSRIPSAMRKNTPVVVRATAGLRLTGEQASQAILMAVRNMLKQSGFRFDADDWATIMTGNDEGIYSWITVNHLLERSASDSVGTMEMGGGSAQIAFIPKEEIKPNNNPNCSLPAENVPFNGKNVQLYTTSHLQFGLQKARELALLGFEKNDGLNQNPCINTGKQVNMKIPFDKNEKEISLSGIGDFTKCRQLLDEIVVKPNMKSCDCDLCTYHGAAQPAAIDEYVAIAFYRERTLLIGMAEEIVPGDIVKKGEEICKMSVDQVEQNFGNVRNGQAIDLCMDLAYISLHLEKGHGISPSMNTKIMLKEQIRKFELGWCLGAMQQTMTKLGLDQ